MSQVKKAALVKDVSRFFTGSAGLYQLTPPILLTDIDSDGHDIVLVVDHVVAADAMLGGMLIGVTLYQSDETGYVTSWERLQSNSIMDSRADALSAIGYEEEALDEERPV